MQIKYIHLGRSMSRWHSYGERQVKLEAYRARYRPAVEKWQLSKSQGLSDQLCTQLAGISRATYYRYRAKLRDLSRGISPPSRRPHRTRQAQWCLADEALVLKLRRANRTFREEFYGFCDFYDSKLCDIQSKLNKSLEKYNTYRPHFNLQGDTPMAYIKKWILKAQNLSHFR